MVPVLRLPPLIPSTSQLTGPKPASDSDAENACVPPAGILATEGDIDIDGFGVTLIVALAEAVESATLVAVT
jgi:hypothetical protein